MSARSIAISDKWRFIQDIVGPARLWPLNIRHLFWKQNLTHFERIILCAFAYVNGLHPDTLIEWAVLLHSTDRLEHLRQLFNYFDEGRYARSLYSYCVSQRTYRYLDGTTRYYIHRSQRN